MFQVVQEFYILKPKQNVLICSKFLKNQITLAIFFYLKYKTTTKPEFFIIRWKCFHTPRLRIKQNRIFYNFFFTSLERLYLLQASPISKLNLSIKQQKIPKRKQTNCGKP
jgi:hypothetical protein